MLYESSCSTKGAADALSHWIFDSWHLNPYIVIVCGVCVCVCVCVCVWLLGHMEKNCLFKEADFKICLEEDQIFSCIKKFSGFSTSFFHFLQIANSSLARPTMFNLSDTVPTI